MRRKVLQFPNGKTSAETNREQAAPSVDGSLRDRIAYAIAQADGDEPGMEPASCDYEMADAVIEALNLDIEHGCPTAGHHGCRCAHRYVTEWEPDEPA